MDCIFSFPAKVSLTHLIRPCWQPSVALSRNRVKNDLLLSNALHGNCYLEGLHEQVFFGFGLHCNLETIKKFAESVIYSYIVVPKEERE